MTDMRLLEVLQMTIAVFQMTTVQHIEPFCMSGVANVREVSMGWRGVPLE
jgi:hypothetical protein